MVEISANLKALKIRLIVPMVETIEIHERPAIRMGVQLTAARLWVEEKLSEVARRAATFLP
jgi:hypothetical protein